ncbi:divergent polysaccharide deacetylase family protein [Thalassotalea sp. PP2-459]|uniref:divergent polysaccharide deacetylase family protein n=1 Tax=Thalassotalea sp. PP2-459 TaxID=1742724 RepID=UPI00094385AC|nr:divergent polysaccharide deacetylase family protein [Thalassotalea sp. PP2-459]OKY26815.1 hypothetical protein BI291_02130 [Thalassotalea sp. PP2-459]
MTKYSLLAFFVFFACQCIAQNAQVAIIIDDIGYRKTDSETLALPGNITFAVLPHTPFGKVIAEQAHQSNKDVIIHVPMESTSGKALGPGALTAEMDETEIRHTLTLALEEIPFAVGINNHMGSKLTTLYSPMAWTMRFLKEKELIFIDSVTTRESKARSLARQFDVPNLSRRVFLDNQLDQHYIRQQFNELIYYAKKNKRVVAIAHPHPETMQALQTLIPELAKHNIDLVNISALLSTKSPVLSKIAAED